MKITKLWESVLVFSMCTTLGACQNKSEKNIKDGTYTTEVEGYQSSLTVEVTFSNGSITSVEVVDSNETKTWADSALQYIPKYIHELVPEYKLYMRHYSKINEETVIYAIL